MCPTWTQTKSNISLGKKNLPPQKSEQFSQNSSTTVNDNKIDVRAKLAKTAGVSTNVYS